MKQSIVIYLNDIETNICVTLYKRRPDGKFSVDLIITDKYDRKQEITLGLDEADALVKYFAFLISIANNENIESRR